MNISFLGYPVSDVDKDCVVKNVAGLWMNNYCYMKYKIICERLPGMTEISEPTQCVLFIDCIALAQQGDNLNVCPSIFWICGLHYTKRSLMS